MLTHFSKTALISIALGLMILLQVSVLSHAVTHYQEIGLELSHHDHHADGDHEAGCDICLAAKLLSWTVFFGVLVWSLLKTVQAFFVRLPDSWILSTYKSFYAQAPPAKA